MYDVSRDGKYFNYVSESLLSRIVHIYALDADNIKFLCHNFSGIWSRVIWLLDNDDSLEFSASAYLPPWKER